MKLIFCLMLLVVLTGCSHNAITYSDGIGLETTANPETFTFGLNFRYGKIFTAVLRENSEVEMSGDGKGTGNETTGSTSAAGGVKIKIGKQITGYYVEAMKAGATNDKLNEYLKQEQSK